MPATEPTRCILLTPPRGGGDANSRRHLPRQDWEVTLFDDAVLAMAELAVCERGQAARSAWGLERATRLVLAVDEPDACPHLPAMLAAVVRYMPSVAVWDCSGGQLKPMPLPAIAQFEHRMQPTPENEPQPARNGADRATISREEINMLLETGGLDQ